MAAIRIRGLCKSFRGPLGIGRTPAVEGLDLTVEPGEIFGLLGPNGAGKTTTMKLLLGLLRPDSGESLLFGGSVSDPATRARLGYLPENPYFYDYLTAAEFLDFYARLQGIPAAERRRIVQQTLERVGLAGRDKLALRKFSKGMLQRLGLAQAIQHDPELVILDEPMSGLDPIGRREVRDLILSLKAAGKTVFFSSHILQDAEMICDRIGILQRGRLGSVGLLREMISGTVEWFEVAVRGGRAESLPGELLTSTVDDLLLKVPDIDALQALLAEAKKQRAQVISVWPRRESLEDLFMRHVRKGEEVGS